jgi:hypothetical protein
MMAEFVVVAKPYFRHTGEKLSELRLILALGFA